MIDRIRRSAVRRWIVPGTALAALAGGAALFFALRPARAAIVVYDLEYRATTVALDGTKVPFVATGNAILDTDTGMLTYNAEVPEIPASISGSGTLVTGVKGSYGLSSFDSGSWQGTAIFTGKFRQDGRVFKGKIVVAIPNHFGPAPGGFTYTQGKVTLIRNDAPPE